MRIVGANAKSCVNFESGSKRRSFSRYLEHSMELILEIPYMEFDFFLCPPWSVSLAPFQWQHFYVCSAVWSRGILHHTRYKRVFLHPFTCERDAKPTFKSGIANVTNATTQSTIGTSGSLQHARAHLLHIPRRMGVSSVCCPLPTLGTLVNQ